MSKVAQPSRKTHSRNPLTTSIEFWRTCRGASLSCITSASQSMQGWSRNPRTTSTNLATVLLHLDEYAKLRLLCHCQTAEAGRQSEGVFFLELRPNHGVTEMQANWCQSFGLECSFSWYLEWNLSVGEKWWCELDVILVEVGILRRSWSVHWQEVEIDPESHRTSGAGIVVSDVLVRSCGLLRRP